MKYKISFQGWDTEVLISESTEKMFDHFKDNGLDVSLHMCGTMEDELSEDITGGVCYDTKFECDDLYHNCGPNMDGSVTMRITESDTDEEIYSCSLDEWMQDVECEQDVCLLDFDPRYVMVGQIFSKGQAAEYVLELNDHEQFDPSKLTLLYHDIDEMYQIVTGVKYNDVDLECSGFISSIGRDERWFIEDTETRERTID